MSKREREPIPEFNIVQRLNDEIRSRDAAGRRILALEDEIGALQSQVTRLTLRAEAAEAACRTAQVRLCVTGDIKADES